MNRRLGAITGLLVRAAQAAPRAWASSGTSLQAAASALLLRGPQASVVASGVRSLHSSLATCGSVEKTASSTAVEPARKFRSLADKELWHEAWMYEDKFGSEDDPIVVPSLEAERIIGVTDPEDDNLVVWGILRADEPPRQFVEGGEFYVLTLVESIKKVGDVLEELDALESGDVKAA